MGYGVFTLSESKRDSDNDIIFDISVLLILRACSYYISDSDSLSLKYWKFSNYTSLLSYHLNSASGFPSSHFSCQVFSVIDVFVVTL